MMMPEAARDALLRNARQIYRWWPDWEGDSVAIVAGGPSVIGMDLSILQNHIHVIAIKTAVDLCPWAEVCYGCDAAWWIDRKGLPKFHGLKFFHGMAAANKWPDLKRVDIEMSKDLMLMEKPLKLGNGGNSGFQSMNLALQFGAKDIILVGFDCHDRGGIHWYGRNKWMNANNPMQSNFNRWAKGFHSAKKDLDRMGVTVINTSETSDLECFPKMPLIEVMRLWGL